MSLGLCVVLGGTPCERIRSVDVENFGTHGERGMGQGVSRETERKRDVGRREGREAHRPTPPNWSQPLTGLLGSRRSMGNSGTSRRNLDPRPPPPAPSSHPPRPLPPPSCSPRPPKGPRAWGGDEKGELGCPGLPRHAWLTSFALQLSANPPKRGRPSMVLIPIRKYITPRPPPPPLGHLGGLKRL